MTHLTNAEKRAIWAEGYLHRVMSTEPHCIAEWNSMQDFAAQEALRRYPDPTKDYRKPWNPLICPQCGKTGVIHGFGIGSDGVFEVHCTTDGSVQCEKSVFTALMEQLKINSATPDPYEPTIVTMRSGQQYRIVEGRLEIRNSSLGHWEESTYSVSDILDLAKIAQEYSERTK